jgi:hypothetical protein
VSLIFGDQGGLVLAALELARPGAAWALLLAPAFLVLVRLAARPPEVVIGTLELWEELPRATRGTRTLRRLPAWTFVVALALLFGALAWSGPRVVRGAEPRTWTCVVDTSPSMHLPLGDGTRLDAALARAGAWLARELRRGERVRWLASERPGLELRRDELPPPAWRTSRAGDEREPEWERFDRAGVLWITDRAPSAARERAGLFASGGEAVPGWVAADGRERVRWDGRALVREPGGVAPLLVLREPAGRALPPVLARVLTAWSEARGWTLARQGSGAGLELELAAEVGAHELELGRDGWSALGRGGLRARARAEGEDWLLGRDRAGALHALVRARPGHVLVGLAELGEPRGDPAAFALSFGRLLDRYALAPEGVVSLAERVAAGVGQSAPGLAPTPEAAGDGDRVQALEAGLALAAAVAAGVALVLRLRVR